MIPVCSYHLKHRTDICVKDITYFSSSA